LAPWRLGGPSARITNPKTLLFAPRLNTAAFFSFLLFKHATMNTRLKNTLKSPFPYFLNDERKNFFLSLAISAFVVILLVGFNPMARVDLHKTFLIALITFLVLFPAVVITPRLFPAAFDTVGWTFGKHLVFTAAVLLAIGAVISTVLYLLNYYPYFTFTQTLKHCYPDVFIYGMVPSTILTLAMKNRLLKQNLDNAILANHELAKIHMLKGKEAVATENSLTIHSDTSETLRLNLPELLFVEASDNYSTFFWKQGAAVEKKMMRMNLKNVESQLNNSFTLRCHRSFIVNIYWIDTISGNTNGYKLTIAGSDFSIPVSRSKGKEVIEKIGQIRSIMELRQM
jgi:DNA-binding LytR/AlgR family response regulator